MGWAQAQVTGTRPYIPGPCGLWRLDLYLRMTRVHPFLPFGEDIFGSYHALCLRNGEGERRYHFSSEMRCHVTTFAPPVMVQSWLPFAWMRQCCQLCYRRKQQEGRVQGYGAASLWKQRAHRWTVSGLRVLPLNLYCFFFYRGSKTWTGALMYRLFRLREYKMIFLQVSRRCPLRCHLKVRSRSTRPPRFLGRSLTIGTLPRHVAPRPVMWHAFPSRAHSSSCTRTCSSRSPPRARS